MKCRNHTKRKPRVILSWILMTTLLFMIPGQALADFTFGTEEVIASVASTDHAIAKLDSTHVVIAYIDEDDFNKGKAVVGTISGSSISFGTPVEFTTGVPSANIDIVALSSTKVAIGFQDNGTTGTTTIGTISGTAITFGSEYTIPDFDTVSQISLAALDNSKFTVVFRGESFSSSNYGHGLVASVSGTTVSYGTAQEFSGATPATGIDSTALDSTHIAVAFDPNDGSGKTLIGTISGTSISFDTPNEEQFSATDTNSIRIAALSSSKYLLSYVDISSGTFKSLVATLSGSTISLGSATEGPTASSVEISAFDATSAVITYVDTTSDAVLATISGSSVSLDAADTYDAQDVTDTSVATLSSTSFVIAYRDPALGNNYGTAIVGSTSDTTNPTISTLSPTDGATNVATNSNLVITFDEAVDAETGNITIKKSSDNSTVATIDVTSGLVTGSGSTTITINPSSNLAEQTGYYINIDATAFDDTAGNSFAGINNTTSWNFTTADETNPTVSTFSPADNATSVATSANLVITFNEAVDAETGNITIKKTSDNSTVETIGVSSGQVTGSGSTTITINPASNLAEQTGYYINIDATAFDDTSGNSFAGISNTTTWNFTTADETNPVVSTLSPTDNATDVAVDTNLVITFTEAVDAETGNITIKKTADNSTVEAINVAGAQVTGSGSTTITINPSVTLINSTGYYVQIAATAFDDTAGNSYAGINDTTSWSFTTVAAAPSNTAPTATTPGTITQLTDGSGQVTFKTTLADSDGNATQLQVEYSTDASDWKDLTLVSVSANQGEPSLNNSTTYQIQSIATDNGNITLTITWDTTEQFEEPGDYHAYLRVTPYDGTTAGTSTASERFNIDLRSPTVSAFAAPTATTSTLTLSWQPDDNDDNFDQYRICYSQNQTTASNCNLATNWDADDDSDLSEQATPTTTITGLLANTKYFFVIKSLDEFGHSSVSPVISASTLPPPTIAISTSPSPTPTPISPLSTILPIIPEIPPTLIDLEPDLPFSDPVESNTPSSNEAAVTSPPLETPSTTSAILQTVQNLTQTVAEAPVTKTINNIAAPLAATTLLASSNVVSALPSLATQATSLSSRIAQAVLGLLGFRGRRKPWGRVVDVATNKGISGAVIYIISEERQKVISTLKSDKNGNFSAFIPPGTYNFQIIKRGWQVVPDAAIPTKQADEQIYAGRPVTLTEETLIKVVFALQPTQAAVQRKHLSWQSALQKIEYALQKISWPILIMGATLSTIILFNTPTLFNVSIEVVYALLIGGKVFIEKRFRESLGTVIDAATNSPLDLASIRLHNAMDDRLVATQITAKGGHFLLRATPGVYTLMVTRVGYQPYREGHLIVRSDQKPVALTIPLNRISFQNVPPSPLDPATPPPSPITSSLNTADTVGPTSPIPQNPSQTTPSVDTPTSAEL